MIHPLPKKGSNSFYALKKFPHDNTTSPNDGTRLEDSKGRNILHEKLAFKLKEESSRHGNKGSFIMAGNGTEMWTDPLEYSKKRFGFRKYVKPNPGNWRSVAISVVCNTRGINQII